MSEHTRQAVLSWLDAQQNDLPVASICFKQPHRFRLRSEWPSGKQPQFFSVHEVVPNFVERAARAAHLVPTHPPLQRLADRHLTARQRSETKEAFALGATGPARQTTYKFEDGKGAWSPVLVLSSVGIRVNDSGQELEPAAEVTGAFAAVWSKVRLTVGRIWRKHWEVGACIDPALKAEILLPWEQGPLDLRHHAENVLAHLDFHEPARSLERSAGSYFPLQNPGIEVWIDRGNDSFYLNAGEAHDVIVNVQANRPTSFAFALRVFDADTPSSFVVSDVVEIDASEADNVRKVDARVSEVANAASRDLPRQRYRTAGN